jgi:diaminohydroxyphosphoribosylaminopyrimidine deaminase/5-amino-6-(5-phosphoribosylamino)uracil reductase
MQDKLYFQRCFDLAELGSRHARPNPRVGAVIVYKDKIIGEGYHKIRGSHHAEVNALNSVKEEYIGIINQSTIYISLEPCHHHGMTPPCVDLIIKWNIPRVRIALPDPTEKVYFKSIEKLKENGCDVTLSDISKEAKYLINEFEAVHLKKRPFLQIKMVKSTDNYIGQKDRQVHLSNPYTNVYTHKLRAYTDAILVGTNTAIIDNPRLNLRNYPGKSPIRIVLDRSGKLPHDHILLSDKDPTIVVTQNPDYPLLQNKSKVVLDFGHDEFLDHLCTALLNLNIYHVMIEGGAALIKSFIKKDLWDEAIIIKTNHILNQGIKAPNIKGSLKSQMNIAGDQVHIINNNKMCID